MILRKSSDIPGATDADLRESLAWWSTGKLFIGRAAETGPRHQVAMIAALRAELRRRGDPSSADESSGAGPSSPSQ